MARGNFDRENLKTCSALKDYCKTIFPLLKEIYFFSIILKFVIFLVDHAPKCQLMLLFSLLIIFLERNCRNFPKKYIDQLDNRGSPVTIMFFK